MYSRWILCLFLGEVGGPPPPPIRHCGCKSFTVYTSHYWIECSLFEVFFIKENQSKYDNFNFRIPRRIVPTTPRAITVRLVRSTVTLPGSGVIVRQTSRENSARCVSVTCNCEYLILLYLFHLFLLLLLLLLLILLLLLLHPQVLQVLVFSSSSYCSLLPHSSI